MARPSLSPSKFSEGAFDTFQESNARAKDEDDVLANVIPAILGTHQPSHASARNTVFGNLQPLTDGTIALAKPDIYYGAHPEELSRPVRDKLGHHIVPSTMRDKPLAPNFFVEVKGPDGNAAVAMRQARYDGAIGSRAMHSLQNYGEEEVKYDNQPHTFSSTYHGGQLQLYAHHTTQPTSEEGPPTYHITKIRGFDMTDTHETFVQGATVFRNARDLAKEHRDRLIQAANAKAASLQNIKTHHEGGPATDCSTRQDDDGEPQAAANDTGHYLRDRGKATASLPPREESDSEEPSQDSGGLRDNQSMSFTSTLTSSFGSSKRTRQRGDPPGRDRSLKSQRPRKRRAKSTTSSSADGGK